MVPISDNSCGVRCTKYPDVSGVNKAVLVSYSLRMETSKYSFSKRLGPAALRDWGVISSLFFVGFLQASDSRRISPFCRFSISQAYLTAWNQYFTLHTYTEYSVHSTCTHIMIEFCKSIRTSSPCLLRTLSSVQNN